MFKSGELQTESALNLIVFGPHLEHLDLIEYVIVDLLKAKWDSYIKKSFFRQFFAFSIYFCFSTIAFTLRHNQDKRQKQNIQEWKGWEMSIKQKQYQIHGLSLVTDPKMGFPQWSLGTQLEPSLALKNAANLWAFVLHGQNRNMDHIT